MMEVINIPKNKTTAVKNRTGLLYMVFVLLAILLFLRDSFDISINKYIFIIIIIPYILFAKFENAILLWVAIMPLYVGLPGNYITFAVLLKFAYIYLFKSKGKIKPQLLQLSLTISLMIYVLIQNLRFKTTGTYNMICIPELLLVYLFISLNKIFGSKKITLMYSVGVCTVGIIMLSTTLNHYALSDLLSSTSRLGTSAVQTLGDMNVNIDPNYYGFFVLTALSCNWLLVEAKTYSKKEKRVVFITSVISVVIALIGLSRSFVLCLAIWIVMVLLFQKRFKQTVALLFIVGIFVFVISQASPDILTSIIDRFNESDILTGNNRTILISYWFDIWKSAAIFVIFGIGIFICNVHCMQLQYLFGLGITGFLLIFILAVRYIKIERKQFSRILRSSYIPMLIVQISAATIPIAQSLTFMFPTIITLVSFGYANIKNRLDES